MERCIFLGFLIPVFLQVFLQVECSNSEKNYKVMLACKAKLGERYEQIASGYDDDVISPKTRAIAIEFVGCMWKDFGYINEKGVLNEHLVKKFLIEIRNVSKERAPKILQKCKQLHGKDYHEKAYKVNLCLHKESAK